MTLIQYMPLTMFLQQLEKCIDDALRKNDFKPLKTLLHIDICDDVKIKCSKQFLHKLDDLICRVTIAVEWSLKSLDRYLLSKKKHSIGRNEYKGFGKLVYNYINKCLVHHLLLWRVPNDILDHFLNKMYKKLCLQSYLNWGKTVYLFGV